MRELWKTYKQARRILHSVGETASLKNVIFSWPLAKEERAQALAYQRLSAFLLDSPVSGETLKAWLSVQGINDLFIVYGRSSALKLMVDKELQARKKAFTER